ncbi:MAG: glycogen debranching enzyme N-terminal domain-containing protein, partial [bacterium]|nr:glycogen debranching enzyme N-terminal domain-containing protein [bacterium]
MIRILFKDLLKPENSIEKEWYVTNGLGGFISSSVILCNTRRYHGLLNISLEPPYNRYHTLSSFEEDLVIDKKPFKLGVNQYPGVFNPEGYRFLEEFKFDLYPKFTYRLGKVYLEKEIFMVPFKNETIIIYRVENPFESNISFYFHPYFSLRSIHDLNSNEPPAFSDPKIDKKELKLEISKLSHPIRILSTSGIWKKGLDDLKNVIFSTEKHRGLDFSENLYMPGYLHFSSKASKIDFAIRFSAEAVTEFDPYLEKQNFINEKNKFIKESGAVEETDIILVGDASNFISLKKDRHGKFSKTIIAGYPWFEDWGRDTMISIPGLLLETNHEDIALEILINFTKYLKKGL